MSKRKKLLIILPLAFALILLILFFSVKAVVFGDRIVSTEKRLIDSTALLQYKTQKGENIDITIGSDLIPIAENLYKVQIILNRQGSEHYELNNVGLSFTLGSDVEVIEAFYSSNGPDYTVPRTDYDGKTKIIKCNSDRGYLKLDMIISGEKADTAILNIGYDIEGKEMYSFNSFRGFEENYEFRNAELYKTN